MSYEALKVQYSDTIQILLRDTRKSSFLLRSNKHETVESLYLFITSYQQWLYIYFSVEQPAETEE
jgi:hypothetical protein